MNELTDETRFLIDFNLHQVPAALGLDIPPLAAASMTGIGESEFNDYVASVQTEVRHVAASLLDEPGFADAIRALSVPANGTMMAVGDSITTYRYGYARVLEAMVALARPEDGIRFLNVAQSGYQSAHGLENVYSQFLAQDPDWVCIMFGVNDCKLFGDRPTRTLISAEEYRSNMTAIVEAFLSHTKARPVLMSPTPVVEDVAGANADFAAMRMTWRNSDIRARAAVVQDIAHQYGLVFVDLYHAFGDRPDPGLYLEDGLHPGRPGHRLIIGALLGVKAGHSDRND